MGLESPQTVWHITAIPCKTGKSIVPGFAAAAVERDQFSAVAAVIDCVDDMDGLLLPLIEIWVVMILMAQQRWGFFPRWRRYEDPPFLSTLGQAAEDSAGGDAGTGGKRRGFDDKSAASGDVFSCIFVPFHVNFPSRIIYFLQEKLFSVSFRSAGHTFFFSFSRNIFSSLILEIYL